MTRRWLDYVLDPSPVCQISRGESKTTASHRIGTSNRRIGPATPGETWSKHGDECPNTFSGVSKRAAETGMKWAREQAIAGVDLFSQRLDLRVETSAAKNRLASGPSQQSSGLSVQRTEVVRGVIGVLPAGRLPQGHPGPKRRRT